jgi:UDP-N-acetyl-D-mannosaminuronic acid dehydrogenase
VSEPYTSELPRRLAALPNLSLVAPEKAVEASDIVALLVDHDQFRAMNRTWLAGKVVYDTRGIWR